jgi:hypothetical protein
MTGKGREAARNALRAFLTASHQFFLDIENKTTFYFLIKKYSTAASHNFPLYP